MYSVFEKLMTRNGLRIADVSRQTGIPYSTFTDWKAGRSHPKSGKMKIIADFFGVSVEYLMTGEEADAPYYLSDDAREIAEFLFHHPEYKVLFDATRKVKPEDIAFIKEMIDRLSG